MLIPWTRTLRRVNAIVLVAIGFAVLLPVVASAAGRSGIVSWTAPTPGEGAVLGVAAQTQLSFQLSASAPGGPAVRIQIRSSASLPQDASLQPVDGNPAKATFLWKPTGAYVGDHRLTFTASAGLPEGDAPPRTILVRVGPAGKPPPGPPPPPSVYPKRLVLSDRAHETYRWTFVRRATVARRGPSRSARPIGPLPYRTPENYRNALLMLEGIQYRDGQTWIRVRLSVLPNGATGWVQRRSLERFHKIHTRLVIQRGRLRATLYNRGKPVFKTIVGVGQSRWPTPGGEFYVREKLSGYYAPAYGPRAFGLNARSTKLTDWPGGGFIGIHGTNEPGILPGRVSHGCVRMRNPAIMRLFRMMPLGTPVKII